MKEKKVWQYDPALARPVELNAFLVEGEWHYARNGFVNPCYQGCQYDSEEACLRAELSKEQIYLKNASNRIERIQEQLRKLDS